MLLHELLDIDLLDRHVEQGNVRRARHPSEPLSIYCYTHACQYRRIWDDVTKVMRGLIVHDDTGLIVARPPAKMFNLGEHGDDTYAGPLELKTPIRVLDKVDGSLAISYVLPSTGEVQFASKGSFTSRQAQWANEYIRRVFDAGDVLICPPLTEHTIIAEMIYPENRIVLDYGEREDLVLLAVINTETGKTLTDPDQVVWPFGPAVESFGVVDDPIEVVHRTRPGTEGYVLLSGDMVTRVKVKESEYVRLHALLTGCTNRTIWDYLRTGTRLDRMYDAVPDEFAEWVKQTSSALLNKHRLLRESAWTEYARILAGIGAPRPEVRDDPELRKEFAQAAVKSVHRGRLFALLDENTEKFEALLWADIRPERALPFTNDPDLIEGEAA